MQNTTDTETLRIHGVSHRLPPLAEVGEGIVVLTGATGGIGRHIAGRLATEGHRLVLLCRNPERAEALVAQVREASGNPSVWWSPLDLSSLDSVRAAAEELQALLPRVDVLINNAGRYGSGFEETVDGFESHLAVNYLAPFLLTHLLLGLVRKSPAGRIVNVAGETARMARIDLADLNRRRRFSVLGAYGQSKLALLSFTRLLAESVEGSTVTANGMQPGMAATEHLSAGPGWLDSLWRGIAPSPTVAARAVAQIATGDRDPSTNGVYYFGRLRAPAPCAVYRDSSALPLYEQTAEMVGLTPSERILEARS